MAITSETSSIRYSGNDSDSTPYAVPFRFLSNAHLSVVVVDDDGVEEELDLGADFTATGAGTDGDGEIVTAIAYDDTHEVIITRAVPVLQPSVYTEGGPLRMKSIEGSLDYLGMILQGVKSAFRAGRRSLGFPISEPDAHSTDLPTATVRKGKWIRFDNTTGELALIDKAEMVAELDDLRGPQGDTGNTGPQGNTGAQGNTGPQGEPLPPLYIPNAPVANVTLDENGNQVADGRQVAYGTHPNWTWLVCRVVSGATTFVPFVPDKLTPAQIILQDATGVVLDEKSLAVNATGEPVLGDGVTPGGNVWRPVDPEVKRGVVQMSNFVADKEVVIAAFPITAGQAVVGSQFLLTGKVLVFLTSGTRPDAKWLGIIPSLSLGIPLGLGLVAGWTFTGATVDVYEVDFSMEVILEEYGGGLFRVSPMTWFNHAKKNIAGTITGAVILSGDNTGITEEKGNIGAAQNINLVFQSEATPSSSTTVGQIVYDLRFKQTA